MIVSVTRLRLRSWRYAMGFAWHTTASLAQTIRAPGFIDGRLRAGRRLAFWTVTRWSSEEAMRTWRGAKAHGRAMPRLATWCDEASVVRWADTEGVPFPGWDECHRRMAATGRLSALHCPSNAHAAGSTTPEPHVERRVRTVLPFRRLGRTTQYWN